MQVVCCFFQIFLFQSESSIIKNNSVELNSKNLYCTSKLSQISSLEGKKFLQLN